MVRIDRSTGKGGRDTVLLEHVRFAGNAWVGIFDRERYLIGHTDDRPNENQQTEEYAERMFHDAVRFYSDCKNTIIL